MVIGKAHFELHSQSYGTKNSLSLLAGKAGSIFIMLCTEIVIVFLNHFIKRA
jgi:hypothetical protein